MNKQELLKKYGSIRAAAQALGVPRTTLRWQIASKHNDDALERLLAEHRSAQDQIVKLQDELLALSRRFASLEQAVGKKADRVDMDAAVKDLKLDLEYYTRSCRPR